MTAFGERWHVFTMTHDDDMFDADDNPIDDGEFAEWAVGCMVCADPVVRAAVVDAPAVRRPKSAGSAPRVEGLSRDRNARTRRRVPGSSGIPVGGASTPLAASTSPPLLREPAPCRTAGCDGIGDRSGFCVACGARAANRAVSAKRPRGRAGNGGNRPVLTHADVASMRRMRSSFRTQAEIAAAFGVTIATVRSYLAGTTIPDH